jgi:ppGpp synthetase/RelA/SpoT-type nucleotidyltranferase
MKVSDSRTEVELDALRVLSGADEVRKKLLSAMDMGNPSIDQLAYLIKCRIKNHGGLVEKVLDRKKKKPSYKASDVTDIVGLRILALYRADLPTIIRQFLRVVSFASEELINLFAGPGLHQSIHEIIIYRASSDADVVDELILAEFEKYGLTSEIVPEGTRLEDVKAHVKIVRKQALYSSIHLVFWCYGFTKDRRYRVPLEVQVRTTIEDVWSEIDHSLNYKIKEGSPDALDSNQRKHYDNAKQYLRNLKGLLDNCTTQADIIHDQIQLIFGSVQERKPNPTLRSVDTEKLLELDLAYEIRQPLRQIVESIRTCFDRMYSDSWPSSTSEIITAIDQFDRAAGGLERCIAEYNKRPSTDARTDKDINYYLRTERCLCLYWVAYLAKVVLPEGER